MLQTSTIPYICISDSISERKARGIIKSMVERMLSKEVLVICDSLNYIKGKGILKRVVWYFEESGVVFLRGWYGTRRGRCGNLKTAVWYFEESCVVFLGGCCGTLKRAVWYF